MPPHSMHHALSPMLCIVILHALFFQAEIPLHVLMKDAYMSAISSYY